MRSSAPSSLARRLTTALLAASLCLIPNVAAITFTPVAAPNLNLDGLGRVALAGDFDSISLYQFEGQTQNSFSTNGSQSLLARFPNGAFTSLQSADAYIRSMCPFVMKDGTLAGVVVGGNFTSMGGVETQAVALFNPNTSQITPLPGLSGKVTSVFCDQNTSTVYVGGSFSGANSTNAIAWTTGWTNLPFAGFNGQVNVIKKAPNGNIIFGGSFTGLGNTTTPQNPDIQVIPISSGTITGTGSSGTAGLSDPRNIICKTGDQDGSGNTWLLADGVAGSWQAKFEFGFNPTKLRLYNTRLDGRGTKTFRFTALPDGGIMNLTHVNADGTTTFCDAKCTLPENNATFQDFHFVNSIGMNGFRIDISEFYGAGGGLAGLELFQDDIYSFAINDFNEPACDGIGSQAKSTATGPWRVTPSGLSNSEYLSATFTDANINTSAGQVVFTPNIKQSGNYTVTIYTPGCVQDNTCTLRGRVNITGTMATSTKDSQPINLELFQTNNFDKYDSLYYGYVDASTDSFQPSVTLTPSSGQSGPLTVVAQRVRFELLNSTGGLNSLFEFNPNLATLDTDFSKSNIDTAGMDLNTGAVVNAIEVEGDTTYVAGNFTTDDFSNIFAIGSGGASSLPGGGLNSFVRTTMVNGTTLYVGGNFTNTRDGNVPGLNGIAAYSIANKAWQALGAGVNGVVMYIVPISLNITANVPEIVITVNGNFNQVNAFGSNSSFTANGFAIWVPSRSNWLHNLGISNIAVTGRLTAETDIPGSSPLFAGSISSQALEASDAVALNYNGGLSLESLSAQIQAQNLSSTSSVQKRAVSGQNITGAVTGLIYDQNNLNLTIIAGRFSAKASNGSIVENLVFVNGSNGNQVTGLPSGIASDSTFLSLGYQGTNLYAGGSLSGTVGGETVRGIVIVNLQSASYATTQPPALTGSSVSVNAIAPQPSTANIYVGGNFDGAEPSFSCPSLCLYDGERTQWNSPGAGLGGSITAMTWISDTRLVLGGNLTVNNVATNMVTYDAKSRNFTAFSGADSLPGTVTAFTTGNGDGSQFWAAGKASNGSTFIEKYDGSQWISVGYTLGASTTVRGLQVLSVSRNHATSDSVPQDEVLLVLGQIELPGFGNASAALFNGTAYQPFLLANNADNGPGSLSQVFVQFPNKFFNKSSSKLALGWIVLISLGIALALTFLLIVAGILAERIRRKREGYAPAPTQMPSDKSNLGRVPPEQLFSSIGPNAGRSTVERL